MNAIISFLPILTISIGSLIYLVSGKLLERTRLVSLVAVGLITAAMVLLGWIPDTIRESEYGLIVNDFSRFVGLLACGGGLLSLIATRAAISDEKIEMLNEYYFLLLTALSGALVMIFSSDYLTLFIGVEVSSLALYCLCGARVDRATSSEASLKYFLLGCFSSAFLLLGIALWYGATGSLSLVAETSGAFTTTMVFISLLLMLVGIGFKVGLAPFHLWVPDVYQGAPTSVTTFMSCVVKVAAIAALLKVLFLGFLFPQGWSLSALWVMSVLAMTLGNLAALQQRSVKRMLAYSSVAQAGYMLVGIVSTQYPGEGIAATLYYLTSYCAMTIGAFAVLAAIGPDADDISDLRGLSKRSPFLTICMTLTFLGLAGLPPSLAGLMGKIFIFSEAIQSELYGLAIIGVLNSALACAYYFRVPVAMLFQSGTTTERIRVSPFTAAAIGVCAAAVVLLGIFVTPALDLARDAALSLLTS
jgi:NADH-quinone oxidoreductase subunit N